MANNIPRFRSYNQTVGEMVAAFVSRYGIKNLKVGSGILSQIEAAAQSDVRTSQDIFTLLASDALDRAEGLALDRKGADERVPRLKAGPATGLVTITDSSFLKISSKVFQGTASPIVGVQAVNVDATEALLFPSSGTIYIGRNTPNYEGPLSYSSKTVNGTYTVLNLTQPTTKFHNAGEEVVVGQGGDRNVGVGVTMRTPQQADGSSVQFRTVYDQTLLDGEVELSSVLVVCSKPGLDGNVSRGAISDFTTNPFTGATVTNASPFTNGVPVEDDNTYRQRIKDVVATRQKGTDLAILTSIVNVVSPDEGRRITSGSLVSRVDYPSTLYIDDGSGYEGISEGVGFETLLDIAGGGEQFAQPTNRPITKAFVKSVNQAPYVLQDSAQLAVYVGGILSVHNFDANDFVSIQNASAYEVVSSINSNSKISFSARTAESGKYVVLFAKAEDNDDIEVTTVDAPAVDSNEKFLFPTNTHYTALLYKNDRLLNKDGSRAILESLDFDAWLSISGDQTLIIAVDGTPKQTYTFTNQDFIDFETGYGSVGNNSLAAWAIVLNARVPGVTVTVEDDKLIFVSNKGYSEKASVVVDSASTLSNKMFLGLTAYGAEKDFKLDRATAQFRLEEALDEGDELTLGSAWTKSFVESVEIASATIATTARMWFGVDGDSEPVKIRFGNSYTLTSDRAFPWGHSIKVVPNGSGSTNYFTNVREGDWLILWDNNFDARIRKPWRVADVKSAQLGAVLTFDKPADNAAVHDACYQQLLDFRVLVNGGLTAPTLEFGNQVGSATATANMFDGTAGSTTWTEKAKMNVARHGHASVTLNNGNIVVAGGEDQAGNYLNSIEIYDIAANTWTVSGLTLATPVRGLAGCKTSTGEILFCGGVNSAGTATSGARLFNATVTAISSSPVMVAARYEHQLVVLGAEVFVAGGRTTGGADLATTEKFNGAAFVATLAMPGARSNFAFGFLDSTRLIAAGGRKANLVSYGLYDTYANERYAIYSTSGNTWSLEYPMLGQSSGPALEPVKVATAVVLPNSPTYLANVITAGVNGALTVDGVLVAVGERLAITKESGGMGAHTNGIYTVTATGSGGAPYVLTRATDLQTAEQINRSPIVFVMAGTANVSKVIRFALSNLPSFVLGTSSITATEETPAQYQLSSSYNRPAWMYSATSARRAAVFQCSRNRISTGKYLNSDVFMFEYRMGASDKVEGFTYMGEDAFQAYSEINGSNAININDSTDRVVHLFGGLELKYGRPIAVARRVTVTGDGTSGTPYVFAWSAPDGATASSIGLANAGITVTRINGYLDEVSVPSGTYTAYTLAQSITAQLRGAVAETYRTNKVRISTNSYDIDGDLALVAQDVAAIPAGLTPEYWTNLTSHLGSAASTSDIGTQNFKPTAVLYATAPTLSDFIKSAYINDNVLGGETIVIRDREYHTKIGEGTTARATGLNSGFDTQLALVETYADKYPRVGLRNDVLHSWAPNEFATIHTHLAIGPRDDINIVLDKDQDTKRYNIKLYRSLHPTTNVYGATNDFTDADNANLSLASAFGLSYDFKDFAIYMKARGKSHVADAARETLWRWYKEGVGGEAARVRYTYPDEASSAVACSCVSPDKSSEADNLDKSKVNVNIVLGSGAERSNTLFPNTSNIAMAVTENMGPGVTRNYIMLGYRIDSASRDGANLTTLTLQLPDGGLGTGVAGSGLIVGNQLYFKSINGNWTSGVVTLSAVSAPGAGLQNVQFTNTSLGVGAVALQALPGNVSLNTEGESLLDVALVAGDYGYSPGVDGFASTIERLRTFRVLSVGPQYISVKVLDRGLGVEDPYVLVVSDRVARQRGLDDGAFKVFANTGETVTAIVAAVNSLAASETTTTPITGTVVSTGAGTVVLASWDEATTKLAGWTLKDGVNYVAKVTNTLPLANSSVQYNLKFKRAINAELVTNADWINETVYMVPVHAQTLAQWLNTFAVTGISNVAKVTASTTGRKLQISSLSAGSGGAVQVQGGLAESVTAIVSGSSALLSTDYVGKDPDLYERCIITDIARADADGISAGVWVDINNLGYIKKTGTFPVNTEINTIAVDGTVTFNGVPSLWTKKSEILLALVKVEKQGDFVNLEIIKTDRTEEQTLANTSGPDEADYIWIAPTAIAIPDSTISNMPGGNQGAFRIVRVNSGKDIGADFGSYRFRDFETAWIENDTAVEGTFWCRLVVLNKESIVPGDNLVIDTDKFGAGNIGTWKVTDVGNSYTTADRTIKLDVNEKSVQTMAVSPGALTAEQAQLLSIYEGIQAHIVKEVLSVYPHPTDTALMSLMLRGYGNLDYITEALSSVISVRDKLAFGSSINSGVDAYSYDVGLLGEANRVIYGLASDRDTYPGVAANGSRINVSGPVVKRIKLSLSVRTNTSVPRGEVADQIRSAVATVINQSGTGEAKSFSDIIAAASEVVGVISISVISPIFSSTNDLIKVQPYEKLLVLDLEKDISITFVGQ